MKTETAGNREIIRDYMAKIGAKGGKQAAANMTDEKRIERARNAGRHKGKGKD